MAKFYGIIGYATTIEQSPGVWQPSVTEKSYPGDVLSISQKGDRTSNLNDDVNLSTRISIVADYYLNQNVGRLLYVEYLGSKWKIIKVDLAPPRQVLTIGGLYNG